MGRRPDSCLSMPDMLACQIRGRRSLMFAFPLAVAALPTKRPLAPRRIAAVSDSFVRDCVIPKFQKLWEAGWHLWQGVATLPGLEF